MPSLCITHLAVLALAAASNVLARDGPARIQPHGKRATRLPHVIRQGGLLLDATTNTGLTTTTAAPGFISIQPIITPGVTSTTTLPPVSAPPPVTIVSTSTSTPTTTDTPTTTTSSRVTVTQSRGPSVVDLTLTSVVSQSFSAAAASASASAAPTSSGGIGQGTVIAIVVVVSSCAGVFLIWTVFRRWKLRPSRTLEDRLQPIDFSAGANPGAEKGYGAAGGLKRSGSEGSNGSNGSGSQQHFRKASFGSLAGSQGGRLGSERGGPQSDVGSRAGYQPSYPPGSNASGGWAAAPAYSPPTSSVGGGNRMANPYSEYDYGSPNEYGRPSIPRSDTVGSGARYRDADAYNHRF